MGTAAKPEKGGHGRPKVSVKKRTGKAKAVKKTGESSGKPQGRPKLSDDEIKANRAALNKAKKLRKKQLKSQKQQKQDLQKENVEKLETTSMEVVEACEWELIMPDIESAFKISKTKPIYLFFLFLQHVRSSQIMTLELEIKFTLDIIGRFFTELGNTEPW